MSATIHPFPIYTIQVQNISAMCRENFLHQSIRCALGILSNVALPHTKHPPAQLLQSLLISAVALNGAFKFLAPELLTCGGCGRETAAFVTVPVTTVHSDHSSVLGQHDVGFARQ